MTHDNSVKAAISIKRAFLIYLNDESHECAANFAGRVEHIVSGTVSRFESLEDLLAFIANIEGRGAVAPDSNLSTNEEL